MISPPILLTSSVIAMDSSVLLRDQNLRIFHTLESIKKWSAIAPDCRFVICDGSGFDFSSLMQEKFPNLQIECLTFLNNADLIKKRGKGFGEGEIIRYALDHSNYLRQSTWFAKCTAKLWVDNFEQCISEWNGRFLCKAFFANVFSQKNTSLEYIDTRFYLADISFYNKYLSRAHLDLEMSNGDSIEDKFLDVVNSEGLKKILFRSPPVISGVGGGSGKYYNTSVVRRTKEVIRMRMISLMNRFKDLVN